MAACITPGINRLYRVWLRGRVVCETSCWAVALWARTAADKAETETAVTGRWARIDAAVERAREGFA